MLDDSIVFQNLHKVTGKETELPKRFSEATVRYFNLVQAIRKANQEEPSVNCKEHRLNYQQEMATKIDENVFASPWNDSDMVLIVQDQELHVHRSILTLLSPVFKAMLDGHFKEASEDKITLEGKDLTSMVLFFKVLYPPSMFEESRPPLNDESRLSVMALAEEYQCVNLIKQCINEAEITPGNVLKILPYVLKYHQTALSKVYDVIKSSVPTSKLKKFVPEIESKKTSDTMLLTKCHFLEATVVDMQDAIITLLRAFLRQNKRPDTIESTGCQCCQSIKVGEICKIKTCPNCKEKYKQQFIDSIPHCHFKSNFLDMLESGDGVANGVKTHELSTLPRRGTSKKSRAQKLF